MRAGQDEAAAFDRQLGAAIAALEAAGAEARSIRLVVDGCAHCFRRPEQHILVDKAALKKSWVDSVNAVALIDELDRMYEQTERLRHLVREKITGSGPESLRQ